MFFSKILLNVSALVLVELQLKANAVDIVRDICSTRNLHLYLENDGNQDMGYGNDNPETNGENRMIHAFINNKSVVFDVGANVGSWSQKVFDYAPTAAVFAFEPVEEYVSSIKERFKNYQFYCFSGVLGAHRGRAPFIFYPTESYLSTLFHRPYIETTLALPYTMIDIAMDSCDQFCEQHAIDYIDFMKIDTEGAEHIILKGAQRMLQERRIAAVQFEYGGTYPDAGTSLQLVYELLTNCGYAVCRLVADGLIYVPSWEQHLESYDYCNYLALRIE